MPKFSDRSKKNLKECHVELQEVINEAIKYFDFAVICGHRGEQEQNEAFNKGNSKLKYPKSKHNKKPSDAVDLAPYPIDWNNIERFKHLGFLILGIAKSKKINLRWGGLWTSFKDYPHFERRT